MSVLLLPAGQGLGAPDRLRGQHPQGPVDSLAADRLAVTEELADLPDGAPGRATPSSLLAPRRC